MSEDDTLTPEADAELRARLQAFAQAAAEHADTETALEQVPRRSRPPTLGLLAIAACLLAVVAVAVVLLFDSDVVDTNDPADSPTDCLSTTQPQAMTPGAPMHTRFIPAAGAATAILLIGACSDDGGTTTVAQGDDIEFVGEQGLAGKTLDVTAVEEDGEVTGEFQVTGVVITIGCADTDTDGVVILGGEVTADPEDDVGVGELLALVIRDGDPDSVALVASDAVSGEPIGIDASGSCTDFLASIPEDVFGDESVYAEVEAGHDIETG